MPTISPFDATFGAFVTDVDLSAMDDGDWVAVENAFHKYAVLVFPEQTPSEAAQIAFAERFGFISMSQSLPLS